MNGPAGGLPARALAGRHAVVTGASRGIGAAVARALSADGARVALIARSREALEGLAHELGDGALALPADLTDASQLGRAAQAVAEWAGGAPDILVNNAGSFFLAPLHETDPGAFAAMVDLNLTAPFRVLRAFLPAMRDRGRGDLVTIGSVADRHVFADNGAYSAAKFGVRALHEVLRAETRGSGLRAMLVSPGPTDTEIWDPVQPEARAGFPPRSAMLRPDDVAEAVRWAVTRPPHVVIEELRLGT